MSSLPTTLPVWIVAAVAVVIVVAMCGWRTVLAARVRWRARARWERAGEAERSAAQLLEDCGYAVVGAQVRGSYALLVDGRATIISLRADYVVTRDGSAYVAEVKSGKRAPLLETASTRRQLLEYLIAFQARGVLLVDGETRRVHEVVFPSQVGTRGAGPAWAIWIIGMMTSAIVGKALRMW